jgi:hypothetical protein
MGTEPEIVYRERTKPKIDNVFSAALLKRRFPDFRFTPLEVALREMVEVEQYQRRVP